MLDGQNYDLLFKQFRKVVSGISREKTADEDWCRDVFHNRVLRILRIKSTDEIEKILRGDGREFRTPSSYKAYLNTIFRHAAIDQLRLEQALKEHLVSLDAPPHNSYEGESHSKVVDPSQDGALWPAAEAPLESEERIKSEAQRIFNDLSREDRQLLSLRYTEERTLEECGKALQLSKSTIERHVCHLSERLGGLLNEEGRQFDNASAMAILSHLLELLETSRSK